MLAVVITNLFFCVFQLKSFITKLFQKDFLDNKSQLKSYKTCPCSFITKLFFKIIIFFSFCESRFAIDLASYDAFNVWKTNF